MADNPKKLKRDRKRIALTQKHEMEYIRKIAREVLTAPVLFVKSGQGDYARITGLMAARGLKRGNMLYYSCEKTKRLAKAFLKLSKK